MPRRRSSSTEFVRSCEGAETPLYLVDASGAFAFGNQALADWLGVDLEILRGVACRRQAAADELHNLAAGLAPPMQIDGMVAGAATRPDGAQRATWFISLGREQGGGVLAVVSDKPPTAKADDDPWDVETLHALVAARRAAAIAHPPLALLGASAVAAQLRRQVKAAAAANETVWISGPEGSGRTRVARHLFALGDEPPGAIVPLATPLLTAELIASTIEAASKFAESTPSGGRPAIVLRSLDEASDSLAEALLKRFSSDQAPVRLAATSSLAPQALTSGEGALPDLVRRLSTTHVALPPLAERREDLPAMAQAVLEECNADGGVPRDGFARDALERLVHYGWTGEAAELDRVVRAAHAAARGAIVEPGDLPMELRQHRETLLHPRRSAEPMNLEAVLADAERGFIERALAEARGNKTEAARLLGLTRPRLYRRMEALGLIEPDSAGG